MNILVIDDDAMAVAIASMVLEEVGHEVTTASDGAEAMALVAGGATFDAVISDMNMPGMDGAELCRKLREFGVQAPFILLSGDDPDQMRQRVPEVTACVAKDDTLPDTLAAVVTRLLATAGA